MKHQVQTNLQGLKRNCWRKNLHGFFIYKGKSLSDKEVRAIVDYGISKGHKYNGDIPEEEVEEVLNQLNKEVTNEIHSEGLCKSRCNYKY